MGLFVLVVRGVGRILMVGIIGPVMLENRRRRRAGVIGLNGLRWMTRGRTFILCGIKNGLTWLWLTENGLAGKKTERQGNERGKELYISVPVARLGEMTLRGRTCHVRGTVLRAECPAS